MRVSFDFGNWRGKVFLPQENKYLDFDSAIHALTDAEWRAVVGRGKPGEGYIRLNGHPFAVGRAARRYVLKERPRGAARYRAGYYDAALAYALSEAIQGSDEKLVLLASHPPQDQRFAGKIIEITAQPMAVECRHGVLKFQVQRAFTADEPLCGLAHYTLTEKGEEKRRNRLAAVTSLVVDPGGWTTDVAAVDPGGQIDMMSLSSTRTGTLAALTAFESALRDKHPERFQGVHDLDVRRVEDAIRTGHYQFGKTVIECEQEAREAIVPFANEIVEVISAAGGVANFDVILLTGGGSALVLPYLKEALPDAEFVLAEPDLDLLRYANAFGGAKIIALLKTQKA